MDKKINRRNFIKTGAAGGLAVTMGRNIRLYGRDDRKVRLGFIGLGNQGSGLLRMSRMIEGCPVSIVVPAGS